MASWSGLGLSGGATAAVSAGAAAVIAGAVIFMMGPEAEPPATPEAALPAVALAPEPQEPVAEVREKPAEPIETKPEIASIALDVVRIDAKGESLVAGRAHPGAQIIARVDGAAMAQSMVDGAGNFVLMFGLLPSETPRLLSLEQSVEGVVLASADTIVIDPIAAPQPPVVATLSTAEPEVQTPKTEQVFASLPKQELPEVEVPEVNKSQAVAAPLVEEEAKADPLPAEVAAVALEPGPDVTEVIARAAASEPTAPILSPELTPTAPRLIRLSREGAQVIQNGARPDTLEIATISYDERGDLLVQGSGQNEGSVQVYIDNEPVETAQIDPDGGWQVELSDVASGVYTLRVDEVGVNGTVTARVETPFERTAPEIVRAAASQSAGVTAVTVQPGYSLWRIAAETMGDGAKYVQVFNANRSLIRDPDMIFPGQVFAIPQASKP